MSSLKKALLINYYWPPSGGPAVQRWVDFACLLLQENIELTVVTIDENVATYPLTDYSLNDKIPSAIKVYKTDTSELFWLYKKISGKKAVKPVGLSNQKEESFKQKVAQFIRGNLFLPDPRKGWNRHAYQQAKELLNTEKFTCIITAGPPHSTHLVGLRLKKEFGIKWIADFHDEWTGHWVLKQFYRTYLANKIDRKLEKKVLQNADKVLAHCPASKDLLAKKVALQAAHKFHIIYMGYNADCFQNNLLEIKTETFTIVYTGTIGSSYQPQAFFKAIKNIINRFTELNIKFIFAGVIASEARQSIQENNLEYYITDLGYIPHKEAIKTLKTANLLLLINPVFEGEKRILPGKLFEYLAVKTPILNLASPDGQSAQMITKTNSGESFSHNSTNEIEEFIEKQLLLWKENNYKTVLNKSDVSHYSRQFAVKQLKAIIDTF